MVEQIEQDPEFLHEAWALYGLGVVFILTRFAVRIRTVGFRGFQGDDFMAILVLAFYTMDAVTVDVIYHHGTNVEASNIQHTQVLSPQEISRFTYGSKEQLVAWYSYTALIWSMKAQMLFFFHRLTMGLWQHRMVKWLGIAFAVSYLTVVLTITFGCFPTHKNWQVTPDPGKTCTLKLQNFVVTVVLNVLTDAALLAIPVPLLWKLKVELKRKILIFILLSSGLFVISAAIIRVVLTLGNNPSALNINRWGVRETIVGILTINLPILAPLFHKSFWSLHSPFQPSPNNSNQVHKAKKNSSDFRQPNRHKDNNSPYELSASLRSNTPAAAPPAETEVRMESQEKLIDRELSEMGLGVTLSSSKGVEDDLQGVVLVQRSYEVLSEPMTAAEDLELGMCDASNSRDWRYVGGRIVKGVSGVSSSSVSANKMGSG